MTRSEIFSQLVTWTPFLLEGFGLNILIAISAALIGTSAGCVLAWLQHTRSHKVAHASFTVSEMFLRVPTLALLFYAAVLLPNELQIPWTALVYPFPNWIKAALALSASQVAFTSHNLSHAVKVWKKGERGAALLFLPSWGNNLLITIIASSSSSLVGVNELVSRCNKVINATGSNDLMIPIYLYASLFFLVFCYPLTLVMHKLKQTMATRLAGQTTTIGNSTAQHEASSTFVSPEG